MAVIESSEGGSLKTYDPTKYNDGDILVVRIRDSRPWLIRSLDQKKYDVLNVLLRALDEVGPTHPLADVLNRLQSGA